MRALVSFVTCLVLASPAIAHPPSAGAPPSGPCAEYAAWLCEETKDTVVACVAMKHLVDILPPAACREALADRQHAKATLDGWRAECDVLIVRLCGDLGNETATCRRILDQRDYFTPDRCHDMLADYGALIQQFRREEASLHPLPADVRARIEAGDAPSFGPADAPVTLVMFSDFECPFCVEARWTAGAVFQELGSRVRFVFRQMPLEIHPRARLAARASLEAHAQGKFWPFHDAVFAHPEQLDREGLVKRAGEVGLDVPRFIAAIDSATHEAEVRRDMELASAAFVTGTPTLFIAGKRFDRPGDYVAVLEEIRRLLPADAPTLSGTDAPSGTPAPSR